MNKDIVRITTEIENRDMLNKVYKVEYKALDGDIYVMYEGDEVMVKQGEFIFIDEQEAKEALYFNLMGKDSTEISEVEELKSEIKVLEDVIKDLNVNVGDLIEEIYSTNGGL